MGLLDGLKRLAKAGKRQEYTLSDDISNGNEANKIPAVSTSRRDALPEAFHYVNDFVELKPSLIDTSISNMRSCSCIGACGSAIVTSAGNDTKSLRTNDDNDNKDDLGEDCSCCSSICYDETGRLAPEYNIDAPEMIAECNVKCKCNVKQCKNRVIQRGCQLKLELFKTKSRGWGVRTVEQLERGTFVGVYSGELISARASYERADDTYLFNLAHQQTPTDEQHFVCDAKFYGNFTRFINHSCQPNTIGIRTFTKHQDHRFPYIAFFARQFIDKNTELTLNYGDNYWLVKCNRDKQYCRCKTVECKFSRRKMAGGKQRQKAELVERQVDKPFEVPCQV